MHAGFKAQLAQVAKESPSGCLNCRHYDLDEGCQFAEALAQGKPRFLSCGYLWRRNFK